MAATRAVLDLRAAQQAYVAAGQGDQFWANKVTTALASLKDSLNTLRAGATSVQAQTEIDGAIASLQDFEQMDRRARDYARSGQKLLASDLIFADGLETTTGAIDGARSRARIGGPGARRGGGRAFAGASCTRSAQPPPPRCSPCCCSRRAAPSPQPR